MRALTLLFALFLTSISFGQIPKDNPVYNASLLIGKFGLSEKQAPTKSSTAFVPSGNRVFVKKYVASLSSNASEQSQLEEALVNVIEGYEKTAKTSGFANDSAAAIAFSVTFLHSIINGSEMDDAAFAELTNRLRATFNTTEVKSASDEKKQEVYEFALCSFGTTVVMAQAANTDEGKKKLVDLAKAQIKLLIGSDPSQLTLSGKTVVVKPTQVAAEAPTTPKAPATGSLAPGFAYKLPENWQMSGGWCVYKTADKSGVHVDTALVRFPAAVPANGNMGDALRKAWKEHVPAEMANAAGAMVYRRYLGNGLLSQFIFGLGREKGRRSDTLFTVFLIDCKTYWQPVVFAQIYEDTGMYKSGEEFSAQYSYPKTAFMAESLFATFTCSSVTKQQIVTASALAGNYGFGSNSMLQWENIYTGATSMTHVSYSGDLNLLPNGKFTYKYNSASGVVGNSTFRGSTGAGTWTIEGDILICKYSSYDQGDSYKKTEDRYRIAGVTTFSDGTKVAILMNNLKYAVNSVSVADGSYWYSTKK